MVLHYYLDESGSSGDLVNSGNRFDFGQQQLFTLACVGVGDEDALGREIDRLKARSRIQAAELKSSSTRDKPELVAELAGYLGRNQWPLMVEVVDKRFMIAANMTNTLIAPPLGPPDLAPQAQWVRNAMAEYLHANAPAELFEVYVGACDAPSAAALAEVFRVLLQWLGAQGPGDEMASWLARFADDSCGEFAAIDFAEARRRFLPLPDAGKRGQSVWMLPNLTSFTNIYARINRLHRRRIAVLTLFHDEQAHFDDILSTSKKAAEKLAEAGTTLPVPFVDYHFEEKSKLVFTGSHAAAGIQAADVLAGFIMRHARDLLYGERSPSDAAHTAFDQIIGLSDPEEGRGVNFVLPTRDMLKLGVVPA